MKYSSIKYYAELLESGSLVAFPTETVYGLGASAKNPSAIRSIFERKGRPTDNPLIVHIADHSMVRDFARNIPESARKLMDHFWPGPLTLVFHRKDTVLDAITAGLDTVAVRMPDNDTALELIRLSGPLVAPSANKSGKPSPTTPSHVQSDFGNALPIVGDSPTRIGIESTVLDVTEEPFQILRPGVITQKQIESLLNTKVSASTDDKSSAEKKSRSPGTQYTHYSPEAEVFWLSSHNVRPNNEVLYLLHSGKHPLQATAARYKPEYCIINYNRDYQQFARELYDRFRQADIERLNAVAIEPFSDQLFQSEEITIALENRISKAIG